MMKMTAESIQGKAKKTICTTKSAHLPTKMEPFWVFDGLHLCQSTEGISVPQATLAPSQELRYNTRRVHLSLCSLTLTSNQPITGQHPNAFQVVDVVYHLVFDTLQTPEQWLSML